MLQFIRDAWPLLTTIATTIGAVTLYFVKLHEWRQTYRESQLKIKDLERKLEDSERRIITPTPEDIRRYGEALRAQGYKVVKETELTTEGSPVFETTIDDLALTGERQLTGARIIEALNRRIDIMAGVSKAEGMKFRLYNTRTKKFLHDDLLVAREVRVDDTLEVWAFQSQQ